MVRKKEVAKLCDKNVLILGICTIFIGIIIGIFLMCMGLVKYRYNVDNYNVQKKSEYENKIKIVEIELNNIEKTADTLENQKKKIQQELNDIYNSDGYSSKYYSKEAELNYNESEIIKNDNLKYEKIVEKNELKKTLNDIMSNLNYNDNKIVYVLPGFITVIIFIIGGFIVISLSYKQDDDELAMKSTSKEPLKTIDEIESQKNGIKEEIKLPSYKNDRNKKTSKNN